MSRIIYAKSQEAMRRTEEEFKKEILSMDYIKGEENESDIT